jgi:hypothetical protein
MENKHALARAGTTWSVGSILKLDDGQARELAVQSSARTVQSSHSSAPRRRPPRPAICTGVGGLVRPEIKAIR